MTITLKPKVLSLKRGTDTIDSSQMLLRLKTYDVSFVKLIALFLETILQGCAI